MSALVADRLRRRVRTAGAEPLITYYEVEAGVRTELSVVTFANWVDKTCNLIADEYALEPGDVVEIELAAAHPGHWVTAVWQLACWQLGLVASVGSGLSSALVVVGPGSVASSTGPVDVLACSLHPLGLGFPSPLPAGVADYALEVRGQPDSFPAVAQAGPALAWADGKRRLTQAELVSDSVPAVRRLVRPSDPWGTCRGGIIAALASGGSVVTVVGDDPDRLARIVADERVGIGAP